MNGLGGAIAVCLPKKKISWFFLAEGFVFVHFVFHNDVEPKDEYFYYLIYE